MIYTISAIDLSGGIVIAWRKNLEKVSFFHSNRYIAFGIVSLPNESSWIVGVVYASTSVHERRNLWSQILNVL